MAVVWVLISCITCLGNAAILYVILLLCWITTSKTSCRWEATTICPRPSTLHAAAQLQPIQALHLACGAQCALLPVAVGTMNIHDVCDMLSDVRQTSDNIIG